MLTRKQFLMTLAASGARAAPLELSNSLFSLSVSAGPRGVWLDRLTAKPVSENLLFSAPEAAILRSGTAILPEGGQWFFSTLPNSGKVSRSSSRIEIHGIQLGPESAPMAREDWQLTVDGKTLTWRVDREFLRDVRIVADRLPALVIRTVERGRFLQIPGFLDTGMRLNGTRMFPLHAGGTEQYEALSTQRAQTIRFSPSGLGLESTLETGHFSMAKPFADGTSTSVSLGSESVDRSRGTEPRTAGMRQRQIWTLRIPENANVPFQLDLPDQFLAGQSRNFATVHNQWMGWLFGNNPASVPVLQEMAWFPMIQSIYPRDAATIQPLEKELVFFAEHGIEEDGFVLPRWGADGFYRAPWGQLVDQVPQFILAMYLHALNTGDRAFVRRVMPALEKVTANMLAMDTDRDGVFEVPGSGLADGGRHCSGWFDIVNFGHKDALINAWCIAALEGMADLAAFDGNASAAARYKAAHRRSVEAYNRVFWDDAHSLYMDWIDVRERMPESGRRYFYTDHNMLAIIFGIADQSKAQRILGHLDRRYQELCQQFKLKREAIYATPANMYPVSRLGDLVDFGELQNQKTYPNYENGCSFFHSTGFEIAARGIAGQHDAAYDAFERVMRHGYARNRLWAAGLKWDTGELISEPLNNALLILWGFVRGCLGVRRSLKGLILEGTTSARLEGARHTFCHFGRDVTVEVRNRRPVLL